MVIKDIELKIWEQNYVNVYAQKGEVDSRYIKVTFIDQNEEIFDLNNKTVTFYALKPDKTQIFNSCVIDTDDNTATVELTSQTLSVDGVLESEFQIFDSENVLLKVNGPQIIVFSNNDFSEAIESTSEFNTLTESLNLSQTFLNEGVRSIKLNGTSIDKDENNCVDILIPDLNENVKSIKINGTSIDKDENNCINVITSDHNIPLFEQGTWTPELIGLDGTNPTYEFDYTNSYYYRVGNLVHITFFIHVNITNAGTGIACIYNLPFLPIYGTDREVLTLSVKGVFASDTVFSVIHDNPYIRIGTTDGSNQSWQTGDFYIGASGSYIKQ